MQSKKKESTRTFGNEAKVLGEWPRRLGLIVVGGLEMIRNEIGDGEIRLKNQK